MQKVHELSESSGSVFIQRAASCPDCKNLAGMPFSVLQPLSTQKLEALNQTKFEHFCEPAVSASGITREGPKLEMTTEEFHRHVEDEECFRYGCQVCRRREFTGLTRNQLREHLKNTCELVEVECVSCGASLCRRDMVSHDCSNRIMN